MDLGIKIRELRKAQDLSISELAEKTELSTGLISQIERDMVCPSVDSLWKISKALNVSIGYFFTDDKNGKEPIVRKNERNSIKMAISNNVYELLSPDLNRKIEFLHITLEPGDASNDKLISHAGEECGIVISGRLMIKYGNNEYILEEGDSIYLDSTIPHRYVNAGESTCVSIWAMTPPSF